MGIISKFLVTLAGNSIGLYLMNTYVSGFRVDLSLEGFAAAASVLTVINFFVQPILKIVLAPVIFLTLGLANFGINALGLYALDYLLPAVTISGLLPLIYATIVLGVINGVVRLSAKVF